jgi:hypothetical protein
MIFWSLKWSFSSWTAIWFGVSRVKRKSGPKARA